MCMNLLEDFEVWIYHLLSTYLWLPPPPSLPFHVQCYIIPVGNPVYCCFHCHGNTSFKVVSEQIAQFVTRAVPRPSFCGCALCHILNGEERTILDTCGPPLLPLYKAPSTAQPLLSKQREQYIPALIHFCYGWCYQGTLTVHHFKETAVWLVTIPLMTTYSQSILRSVHMWHHFLPQSFLNETLSPPPLLTVTFTQEEATAFSKSYSAMAAYVWIRTRTMQYSFFLVHIRITGTCPTIQHYTRQLNECGALLATWRPCSGVRQSWSAISGMPLQHRCVILFYTPI